MKSEKAKTNIVDFKKAKLPPKTEFPCEYGTFSTLSKSIVLLKPPSPLDDEDDDEEEEEADDEVEEDSDNDSDADSDDDDDDDEDEDDDGGEVGDSLDEGSSNEGSSTEGSSTEDTSTEVTSTEFSSTSLNCNQKPRVASLRLSFVARSIQSECSLNRQ